MRTLTASIAVLALLAGASCSADTEQSQSTDAQSSSYSVAGGSDDVKIEQYLASLTSPEGIVELGAWQEPATGELETAAYTCGVDPTAGCGGPEHNLVDARFLGPELHPPGVGCIEFTTDSSPRTEPDDWNPWGVRVTQLDARPELPAGEEPITGKAWLEITVSSVSALSQAEAIAPASWRVAATEPSGPITEMVLIDTTEDMMRWVVGLDEAGRYIFEPLPASPPLWIHVAILP
jgi:hypothetical protein